MAIGVLTGPLFDAGYGRALTFTGTFCIVFGLMMTSLCKTYWQVMLAQGIFVGLGQGCLFVPAAATITQWFSTKRSVAVGLAASGSSIAGIVYPETFRGLVSKIGFGWATRVCGFIALATLLIPCTVMRQRVLPEQKRKLIDFRSLGELPFFLFSIAVFFSFCGLYVPMFFVQIYAIQKKITSDSLGFQLLPILNAASIFGRIIP